MHRSRAGCRDYNDEKKQAVARVRAANLVRSPGLDDQRAPRLENRCHDPVVVACIGRVVLVRAEPGCLAKYVLAPFLMLKVNETANEISG